VCQQKLFAQGQENNGDNSLKDPTTLLDSSTNPLDSRINQPTFTDLWGFEVQWQNTEDGWNPRRRERLIDLENKIIDQVAEMPAFTKEGYKKMKIPSHLYDLITQTINPEVIKTEWCDDFELSDHAWYPLYNCARIKEDGVTKELKNITKLIKVSSTVKETTIDILKPILQKWSKQKISNGLFFGMRRYLRGAWMSLHVDRLPSHIISVILQIDQKTDTKWPLTVIDHAAEKKENISKSRGDVAL